VLEIFRHVLVPVQANEHDDISTAPKGQCRSTSAEKISSQKEAQQQEPHKNKTTNTSNQTILSAQTDDLYHAKQQQQQQQQQEVKTISGALETLTLENRGMKKENNKKSPWEWTGGA
jgi:hypothetical protein